MTGGHLKDLGQNKMDSVQSNHLDDGTLLSLIDAELVGEVRARTEAHIASCSVCVARHEELRFAVRRVTSALELADEPRPSTDLLDVLREESVRAPISIERTSPNKTESLRVGKRSLFAAATLTLLLAAGAYAIPGSPIRGWVSEGIDVITSLIGLEDQGPTDPGLAIVSVEPDGGSVKVSVISATSSLRVTIARSDSWQAQVSGRETAFRVEAGLIEVTDPSGDLMISLPGGAEAVVEINSTVVARLEGGRLIRTPSADDSPAEILVQTGG